MTKNEIEKMLKDHENRIKLLEKTLPHKTTKSRKNIDKKSITDLLVEIKDEGFFDKPKSRKDIVDRFDELGHIYEPKSLDSPILRAIKSRIIGRKMINGIWHYVKR